jgi:hypothetical protein
MLKMKLQPQIDYLFTFGIFENDLLNFQNFGLPDHFILKDLHKSTSIFKKQYIFKIEDLEICTIVFQPHSDILPKNSGMIKFSNFLLYSPDFKQYVDETFYALGFIFKRISRLDICIDFTETIEYKQPEEIIKDFLHQKIKKSGRSKFYAIGQNSKNIEFQYLRFGSRTSEIVAYLYNKSKEMKEQKAKEWIYNSWRDKGWNGVEEVYRLEFALMLQSKIITDNDGATLIDFTIKDIFNQNFLCDLFTGLENKYFHFTKQEPKKWGETTIYKEKRIKFFDELSKESINFVSKPINEGTKANKNLIAKIYNLHQEMKYNKTLNEVFENGQYLELVKSLGLENYANIKGFI